MTLAKIVNASKSGSLAMGLYLETICFDSFYF